MRASGSHSVHDIADFGEGEVDGHAEQVPVCVRVCVYVCVCVRVCACVVCECVKDVADFGEGGVGGHP